MSDDKDAGAATAAAEDKPKDKGKDRSERERPARPVEAAPAPPKPEENKPEARDPLDSPTDIVRTMERHAKGTANAPAAHAFHAGRVRHLVDSVDLGQDDELGALAESGRPCRPLIYQPILIVIDSLRANSKVFISIRDDQRAAWSEGDGKGLVGFSISSSRDPAIYMRSFLVNSREMYVQSYRNCQEMQLQLYVCTAQKDLRGRVELPPGTSVTLQTGSDRTSLVGLSSFTIEFPTAG